jgi:hypothetical protein
MIEITPSQHQLMESEIDQTIKFLDKEVPDWKSKINWDKFDFMNPKSCIAGQLEMDYRSSPGFHMPDSIAKTLSYSYILLIKAHDYMGNIWKQKAQQV